MTRRYTGGFLSATEQVTDVNSSNGIYTVSDVEQLTAAGSFPTGRWTPQRSLRFRSSASTYLSRTPSVAGNRKTWTWSSWVKRSNVGTTSELLGSYGTSDTTNFAIEFSGDTLYVGLYTVVLLQTTALYRDPSAWYHVVVAFDSTQAAAVNRVKLYVNGVQITAFSTDNRSSITQNADYGINNTSEHDIGRNPVLTSRYVDGYLSEVNLIDGQALDPSYFGFTDPETGTWIPKVYTGTYGTNGFYLPFTDATTPLGTLAGFGNNKAGISSGSQNLLVYSNNFTAQVNGGNVWGIASYSANASNISDPFSGTAAWSFTSSSTDFNLAQQVSGLPAGQTGNASVYMKVPSGTLAVQFYVYQPSPFVATGSKTVTLTTSWQRIDLDFTVVSSNLPMAFQIGGGGSIGNGQVIHVYGAQVTLGSGVKTYSVSGDRGDWYPNNFSISGTTNDWMVDVPGIASVSSKTDVGGVVRGNYCTINPLSNYGTCTNGNLTVSVTGQSAQPSSIFQSTGKWYWEVIWVSGSNYRFGVCNEAGVGQGLGETVNTWCKINSPPRTYNNSSAPSYGTDGSVGDTFMFALDLDAGKIWYGINGTWQASGSPFDGTLPSQTFIPNQSMTPAFASGTGTLVYTANFGQRAFSYTPPTGFKSLCTTNLPNPVIKRPVDQFDIKTYTGNGSALTIGNTQKQTSAYPITKSVRLKDASTGERGFTRGFTTAGNTQKMTMSCWVKRARTGISSSPNEHILFSATNYTSSQGRDFFGFAGANTGTVTDTLTFGTNTSGSSWSFVYTNNTFLDTTKWQHLVLAIDTTQPSAGNRVIIYVNGVRQILSGTYPTQNLNLILNSAGLHGFGKWPYAGSSFEGEIAEYNFIDGQQLTPSAFGAFDANNNWVPQAYTGTYGTNGLYLPFNSISLGNSTYAAKFNSSNYVSLPSNAGYAFGTGDFTVEGWFNITAFNSGYSSLITTRGVSGTGFDIQQVSGQLMLGNPTGAIISAYNVLQTNQWTHIAGVRISGVFYLYINGQLAASGASSQNFTDTAFYIGSGAGGGNNAWSGYASNIRVVKGLGVYTGNFTPPNTALTATQSSGTNIAAITNQTVLLTCQNSTLIDNSTNNFTVSTSGTGIPVLPATPFVTAPTYSAQFDGSSQYFTWPGNMTIGTGNFTVEGWFYFTGWPNLAGGHGATLFRETPSNRTLDFFVEAYRLKLYCPTVGIDAYLGTQQLIAGDWYHLALVKNGNVFTGYINGVACDTPRTGNGTSIPIMTSLCMGRGDNYTQGYVSNYRVVNGTAVYTGNFVPPSANLTATQSSGTNIAAISSGTNLLTLTGPILADSSGNGYTITNQNNASTGISSIIPMTATGIGRDYSGNNNHVCLYNIDQLSGSPNSTYDSLYDSLTDTVDSNGNIVGNYCVIDSAQPGTVLQNGALSSVGQSSNSIGFGTIGVSTGKWYYEVAVNTLGVPVAKVGLANKSATGELGDTATGWGIITQNNGNIGQGVHSGSTSSTYTSVSAGDIIMIAWDCDAGKMWVGRNGTWVNSGAPTSGTGFIYGDLSGTIYPAYSNYNKGGSPTSVYNFNFGQLPWAYTPPAGFKSLNTKTLKDTGSYNLPDNFGNFVNTPDLVWIKNRSGTPYHSLYDTVRGPRQAIQSNTTTAQQTFDSLQTFKPNGFDLSTYVDVNQSGSSFVAWNWNRGVTPGFDIVSYGGQGAPTTINHNLGTAPGFVVIKRLDGTGNWILYHKAAGVGLYGYINSTTNFQSQADAWRPGSKDFTITQNWTDATASGESFIAYMWAEVPGFSKFGSFVGNGTQGAGPFVYCGFRPKYVMIKNQTVSGRNWHIFDSVRSPYNYSGSNILKSDTADAELTGRNDVQIDILSNGFRLIGNDAAINENSQTMIYVAFADAPFKYANAR